MDSFLQPQVSPTVQAFIRASYGVLLILTLLQNLPQSRRFFLTQRYGGYAESSKLRDIVQNPRYLPLILGIWFISAVAITVGYYAWLFALVNLVLCRYFFIHMRWRGLLRGMGAPGFMTYWLAACVFFLEYASATEPTGTLRTIALLPFHLDLAAIMFSSGLYKVVAGYHKNQGMQLGMVNPQWGHWWFWYRRLPPDHLIFRFLNQLAWGLEIVFAVLALIPATRPLAALVLIASFLFITTQIRLWVLCEMVMVSAFIYFDPGSFGDHLVTAWFGSLPSVASGTVAVPPAVNAAIALILVVYIGLLPLVHGGLYYNYLKRRALPAAVQRCLDVYTNLFGIIIWRVFTLDVVSFFVNVYVESKDGAESTLWTRWGRLDWGKLLRYGHVGESICVTSVFTTLKYFPSNAPLFRERLLRYARTIPCPPGSQLRFEYVSVDMENARQFEFVPVPDFLVDPVTGAVEQRLVSDRAAVLWGHAKSPIYEGARPGSYAPLRSPASASTK